MGRRRDMLAKVVRCLVPCTLALSACSVVFTPVRSSSGDEVDQEFLIAFDGDPDVVGDELYLGRTEDEVSFIERYDSSATPELLPGRFTLPIVLTAMTHGRDNFPTIIVMGTGDSTLDGKRDTEYLDRVGWSGMSGGFAEPSLSSDFPNALGSALPGSDSQVYVNFIVPSNEQLYTTGHDLMLVDSTQGWDKIAIDPVPWQSFDDPIHCMESHDLGASASEIAVFAGSTLLLADGNAIGAGQGLRDVPLRLQAMPFRMDACDRYRRSGGGIRYLTTDGATLNAIILNSGADATQVSEPLPGEPEHQDIIALELMYMNQDSEPEMVLVVADPPTLYLGVGMDVSDRFDFSEPIVTQALDFTPSAALRLDTGADNTDRLYISESKGGVHCFELGINASGFGSELVRCVP